jgi:hypothetical protein
LPVLDREVHHRLLPGVAVFWIVREHEAVLAPVVREPERAPPRLGRRRHRLNVDDEFFIRGSVFADGSILAHRVEPGEREQPRGCDDVWERSGRRVTGRGHRLGVHDDAGLTRDVDPSVVGVRPQALELLLSSGVVG